MYIKFFSMEMPIGGDILLFWRLWTTIPEDNVMTA